MNFIFEWHRTWSLHCLVNCFGLWLNSPLKWTFLCHIAFVEVEYYFLLFPHGWLRFTHRSLPNLPLHASSFIIIINLFFHTTVFKEKETVFTDFANTWKVALWILILRFSTACSIENGRRTVKHMPKKREV